jgi:hypothetical protein
MVGQRNFSPNLVSSNVVNPPPPKYLEILKTHKSRLDVADRVFKIIDANAASGRTHGCRRHLVAVRQPLWPSSKFPRHRLGHFFVAGPPEYIHSYNSVHESQSSAHH